MKRIIVAIDGFSSCGKSTLARSLARHLGFIYVDTGAMYRGVTYFALQQGFFEGTALNKQALIESLDGIEISFRFNPASQNNDLILNGEPIEEAIRGMAVSAHVSLVSSIKEVRERMVALQRKMGQGSNLIMDGRDIGTVVFPQADLKIFVTADEDIRARRRFDELQEKGQPASLDEIKENIRQRDDFDQNREESPLRKAGDALVLDNSFLTRDEQLAWAIGKVKEFLTVDDDHHH